MSKPRVHAFVFVKDLSSGDSLSVSTLNGKTDQITILDPDSGAICLKRKDTPEAEAIILGSLMNSRSIIMPGVLIVGFRTTLQMADGTIYALTAMQKLCINGEEIMSV